MYILFLIASAVLKCSGICTHCSKTKEFVLSNTIGVSEFYLHHNGTAILQSSLLCASLCGRYPVCGGFAFYPGNATCHTRRFITTVTYDADVTSFISYNATHPLECGRPPHIRGAAVTYPGPYLHAVAHYTCTADYMQCRDTRTSVCLATDEWAPVSEDLCSRNKWHNPNGGTVFPFPCGKEAAGVTIQIEATPTQNTRFGFLLPSNGQAVFVVELSFAYQERIRLVRLNQQRGTSWGPVADDYRFPVEIRKKFRMEIKLLPDRYYEVTVDNITYAQYQGSPTTLKQKLLAFYGDVTVHLVEIQTGN